MPIVERENSNALAATVSHSKKGYHHLLNWNLARILDWKHAIIVTVGQPEQSQPRMAGIQKI
jgi:hypothetical protein